MAEVIGGKMNKLTEQDWDILLRTNKVTFGKTTLDVPPLSTELSYELVGWFKEMLESGNIDVDNVVAADIVVKLAKNSPELISKIICLSKEDVEKLPISKLVEVLNKILENEEELLKNSWSLVERLNYLKGIFAEPEETTLEVKEKKSP